VCTPDLGFTGGNTDIVAGTDTDFIGACTPALTLQGGKLLAAGPTSKLDSRPLSSFRAFLFGIFADILHIRGLLLQMQPVEASYRTNREILIKGISYIGCGVLTKEAMNTGRHTVDWALYGDSEHPCKQANVRTADANHVTPTQQITDLSSTN
jgi:hypothetical protein